MAIYWLFRISDIVDVNARQKDRFCVRHLHRSKTPRAGRRSWTGAFK